MTVKHRIGLITTRATSSCAILSAPSPKRVAVFIVHARNAVLKGLIRKENREAPAVALRGGDAPAHRFPVADICAQRRHHDSTAVRRSAGCVHQRRCPRSPTASCSAARRITTATCWRTPNTRCSARTPLPSREQIVEQMIDYTAREIAATRDQQFHTRVRDVARHMPRPLQRAGGGKAWRRMLSDARLLNDNDPELLRRAMPYQSDYDDHRQPLLVR